jgi:long-chain fatty acid transport protein
MRRLDQNAPLRGAQMSILSRRRRVLLLAATALAAVSAHQSAHAGAFGLREQSATGQGMSFAGMAAGGGGTLSGMFWNPAVVNQVEHFQTEKHLSGIFPNADIDARGSAFFDTLGGDAGDIGENAILTSGYGAYRINERLAIGLSLNTPFGLKTVANKDWAGDLFGRSSRARSINAAPTIGYAFNDWFSVAAGLQIQYFDIRLKQALPAPPGPAAPISTLKGDDIGIGYTLGFTVAPSDWTSIGVGFRSKIKHKLDGEFTNGLSDGAVPGIPDDVDIKAKVTLPELVTVGVRQKVTEDLTLLGGFEWANWSRLDRVKVKVRGAGATLTTLPFDYKDGYVLSGGAEYAFTPDFTGRLGVAYEWSPINDDNRGVRIPDDDRWWLSAGGSYKYSPNLSFDLGYSYVFVPGKSKIESRFGDDDYPLPADAGPFVARAESDVHIVSAAIRYKFGVEPAPALVTKY